MTWEYIDKRLREGSSLFNSTVFGPWLVHPDGTTEDANINAVKAIFRRDLVVIAEKCCDHTYKFRSKYPSNVPSLPPADTTKKEK